MQPSLYFGGRQIKNYLVGFASLFSEIPYTDRKGKVQIVPIQYGSPSDVISFLESNVDNQETSNRNRLKDLTIPLFSFRMTGLERNIERRRAPHDSITVDLRKLGYSTGYVAMRPSPFRFTFELVLWASSDYQAFEIIEQIVPYFNSPQQVTIEPLPRCPVSTTEIMLDTVEVDTDPESQKYSATVTFTFNLTGWLLSQPKIWSTNMSFELNMLDKDTTGPITEDRDYSFGSEIVDLNLVKDTISNDIMTMLDFIISNPEIKNTYYDLYEFHQLLEENGYIDSNNNLLKTTEQELIFKGNTVNVTEQLLFEIIDKYSELDYLYVNNTIKTINSDKDIWNDVDNLKLMLTDITETLPVYLKLLDNNYATTSFNLLNIELTNSDKFAMFGSLRIDINDIFERLRMYQSTLEYFKVIYPKLQIFLSSKEFYLIEILSNIPYDSFPSDFKRSDVTGIERINTELIKISTGLRIKLDTMYEKYEVVFGYGDTVTHVDNISLTADSLNIEMVLNVEPMNYFIIYAYDVDGLIVGYDYKILMYTSDFYAENYNNVDVFGDNSIIADLTYEIIFKGVSLKVLENIKIDEMNTFVVSVLAYTLFKDDIMTNNKNTYLDIILNKFKLDSFDIIKNVNIVKKIIYKIELLENGIPINNVVPTLVSTLNQILMFDRSNKPIYDVNNDGYINYKDLEILNSDVDDVNSFDYVLKYGIWYKNVNYSTYSIDKINELDKNIYIIYRLFNMKTYAFIKDYLILWDKKLMNDTFNIVEDKELEINMLGMDLSILNKEILIINTILDAVNNTLNENRTYLEYMFGLNSEYINLLYTLPFNMEKNIISAYLYFYKNELSKNNKHTNEYSTINNILNSEYEEYVKYFKDIEKFFDKLFKSEYFLNTILTKVYSDVELIFIDNK